MTTIHIREGNKMSDVFSGASDAPSINTEVVSRVEPAKRWRNDWRGVTGGIDNNSGRTFVNGDRFSDGPWPSRDVAETEAEKRLARSMAKWGMYLAEYL